MTSLVQEESQLLILILMAPRDLIMQCCQRILRSLSQINHQEKAKIKTQELHQELI